VPLTKSILVQVVDVNVIERRKMTNCKYQQAIDKLSKVEHNIRAYMKRNEDG